MTHPPLRGVLIGLPLSALLWLLIIALLMHIGAAKPAGGAASIRLELVKA